MRMDKLTTGASYAASTGSTFYWLKQLLDGFSSEQWAAIGVLGSLLLGVATFLTNLYFKRKEDKRKEAAHAKDSAYWESKTTNLSLGRLIRLKRQQPEKKRRDLWRDIILFNSTNAIH